MRQRLIPASRKAIFVFRYILSQLYSQRVKILISRSMVTGRNYVIYGLTSSL